MRYLFNAASTAALLSCALAGQAVAQTAPSSKDETALESIVVTAQRREEKLQNVPVAVSALTQTFISDNQVRTLQDLGGSVPGLVVTNSVNYGSAPLSIRGIGGANGGGNVFADEPVAVYVDEAYVARLRLSTADLIDVEGLEVLRGPQGVLFGRNSTAGALLIRSAAPTADFTYRGQASVATHEEYRAQGAVSGPLDAEGKLRGRLAAGYSSRGGWGDNTASDKTPNRGTDLQLRGYLRYSPKDDLEFDLIADHSFSKSYPGTINISDISHLRDQTTNPTGDNVVYPYTLRSDIKDILKHSRYSLNFPTYTSVKGDNFTGKMRWDLGAVTLNTVTNYREWSLSGTQDSDGTAIDPPNPVFVTGNVSNIGDNANSASRDRQLTQEIRFSSNSAGRLSWLAGAYFFSEHNSVNPVTISNLLAGPGGAGTLVTFISSQTTKSWAGFGSATYAITDNLKLSVGARYSEEDKSFYNKQLVQALNTFDPPGPTVFAAGQVLAAPADLNLKRKDKNFSPRIVLDYKPNDTTLLYASYSQGFKSGGFNVFRGTNVAFEPESTDAYEVGAKMDLMRQLRLNLSAFRYDYSNLQVRTPVPSGGVGIESAKAARSQGVEAELSLAPMEGLRLDANIAYLDAKFTDASLSAVQVQSYVFGTNPAVVSENVSGNRLTRAPKLQLGLSGRYSWDIGDYRATAQASVRHQSKVYFLETQQQAATFQGQAWEEVDLRLAIAAPNNAWEVSLFGKNVLNNRHFSQVTAFFGLPNAVLNEPRKVGLQFSTKY